MCTKVYALVLMLFAVVSVYGQDNVIDEVEWVVGSVGFPAFEDEGASECPV